MLEKRKLGQSNTMLSPLGIGTWQFSNRGGTWNTVSNEVVYDIMTYSLLHGMNWIDTAEIYGRGISETFVGNTLKRLEEEKTLDFSPCVADKWFPLLRSASSITQTIQERLTCLQRPTIDLYQIHQPTSISSLSKQIEKMAELVEQGFVKNIGVSNFSASGMRKADILLKKYGLRLASNQVKYNLLHRIPERNGVIETAKELGISIIAYSPLQQGLLTGRFHSDPKLISQTSRLRRLYSGLNKRNLQRTKPVIKILYKLGEKYKKTPAQISLNWLIHAQGDLVFAIPGATKLSQSKSNAGSLDFVLSKKDIELLNEISTNL